MATRMTGAELDATLAAAYSLGRSDAIAAAGPAPVGGIYATPRVRSVARSLGVDLATVKGTGAAGRITPADVRATAAVLRPAARDDAYPSSWKRPDSRDESTVASGARPASGAGKAYPPHWDTSEIGDDTPAQGTTAAAAAIPRVGKHAGTAYPADWAL